MPSNGYMHWREMKNSRAGTFVYLGQISFRNLIYYVDICFRSSLLLKSIRTRYTRKWLDL